MLMDAGEGRGGEELRAVGEGWMGIKQCYLAGRWARINGWMGRGRWIYSLSWCACLGIEGIVCIYI